MVLLTVVFFVIISFRLFEPFLSSILKKKKSSAGTEWMKSVTLTNLD